MSDRSRSARSAHRQVVKISNPQLLREVCGPAHSHLQALERAFADYELQADSQGGAIVLSGLDDAPRRAADVLETFVERIAAGAEANAAELNAALRLVQSTGGSSAALDVLSGLRRPVMAQTAGQRAYLETLRRDDLGLVFGVGPAGTGKTFLAVAAGAAELKAGKRERLIVARPAVEAGEKLGFLPGALEEKVDPYMLPIWDSLNECLGAPEVERRKERKEIEVAPLAFMRGRTLKNAFVIIDEAQNATVPQMKMVLTRLGRGSRMIVTGDPSQTDLPDKTPSGLAHAIRILRNIPGVAMEELTSADVVRHELVGQIVQAYDRDAALSGAGRRV